MNKLPFSVYDFFAYLSSGILLILSTDYAVQSGRLLGSNLKLLDGSFLTIIAYIVGQIAAGPSAWLLERNVIGKWLGRPNTNLFRRTGGYKQRLFPGYYTPLPESTQKRIRERAKSHGVHDPGEALFLHAFGKMKQHEGTLARLNSFLSLYGFCRNMSFALLIVSLLFSFSWLVQQDVGLLKWASVAILGSAGMFYRYLKFLRQYSYELFVSYAEYE